ncbi:uncharacterized protein LOC124409358 [Diprion similis]|uniref:uncharacterized protein LOC124409358 n=1 Tax=Diprion similis TaxID=362088 RepID=UPI001EF90CBC|nr:uncharacterized protein LOC124409358 [Diprion similis]
MGEEVEKWKQKVMEQQKKLTEQQQLIDAKRADEEQLRNAVHQQQQQLVQQHQQLQQLQQGAVPPPSQNVSFFSTTGSLSEFQIGEDWDLYQERLGQYFVANNVADERRVAVLITLVGQEAYKILKDLCDPVLPAAKTYKELCDILKIQFAPRISVFEERIEYYDLHQKEQETINEWYARVKNKAINCKFASQLDDKIKDKFVTGMRKGPILDRVCEEEHTVTLSAILETARNKEAAMRSRTQVTEVHRINASSVTGSGRRVADNRSRDQNSRQQGQQKSTNEKKCNHCGETRHNFAKCKYKEYKCSNCQKIGHLRKVCKASQAKVSGTHCLDIDKQSDEVVEENLDFIDMFSLVSGDTEPVMVDLVIEGKPVRAEIDSGAGRSVMSERIYKEKFKDCKLVSTKVRLRMYDGSIIVPEGQIEVGIQYKEKQYKGSFVIVKQGSRPLVGRDLMKLLGFEITTLNVLQNEKDLQVLLKEHSSLFDAFKKEISEQLDDLEKKGVIELIDDNSWGTPLVPVMKENGKLRICGDYKTTVNKMIEDVKHPLPRIEELFAALSGGKLFTKLDFTNAYNQLEITEETGKLLAWSTHQVVTGRNETEHLKNLEEVFVRLSKAGFKLNLKKCVFFQPEIKYVGHVIDKNGLRKDPEKVKAMIEVARPQDASGVKAFIGMVNYYGKFIPRLSEVLAPLYAIQKENTFNWSKECEKAFQTVKVELSSERNLVHFNPELPIKLVCDASKVGIGAVLLHILADGSEKPFAYASRVLQGAEKNYAVVQKEALAIYWAVKKFYQYLMGNEFILCTDHKPLTALFGEKKGISQMAAGRLQRWALFLSGFKYSFKYIKGVDNGAADGLSRLPRVSKEEKVEVEIYIDYVSEEKMPIKADDIRKALRVDETLSKVYLYAREGWPNRVEDETFKPYFVRKNEISIEKGLLLWGYRIIIPQKFRQQMLEEVHGTHMGITKMKAVARQYMWWPSLDKQIEEYIQNCEPCRLSAKQPEKTSLIKFREPECAWDRIHIDFLGPYRGKTYLLIIDAYSRWPETFEMSRTDSENTIEKLRECCARFGLPPPYHPSTNGLAENAVGSFKRGIDKLVKDKKNDSTKISTLITRYLASYRNAPHISTGDTPAKRMLGRETRTRLSLLSKTLIETTRERQVKYFHGRREIDLEEGDKVYIRNYKDPAKPTWEPAIIKTVLGSRTYLYQPKERQEVTVKRHTDQIIRAGEFCKDETKDLQNNNTEAIENKNETLSQESKRLELSNDVTTCKNKVQASFKDAIPKVQINKEQTENETEVPKCNIEIKKPDVLLDVNQRKKRIVKPVVKLNL